MSFDVGPDWLDREVACFLLAAVLVSAGTLATGLRGASGPLQLLAGGLIVAGFVVIVACLRDDSPS